MQIRSRLRWRAVLTVYGGLVALVVSPSTLVGQVALCPQGGDYNTYKEHDHMRTPAYAEATVDVADSVKLRAYLATLCFLHPKGETKGHLLHYKGDEKAVGRIIPEAGAINVTEDDLVDGGRIIAVVRVTLDGGLGFPQRHFSTGWNAIMLGRPSSAGGTPPAYILGGIIPPGGTSGGDFTVTPLQATEYVVTAHGLDPFVQHERIVPEFSSAENACLADGARACFLDAPTVANAVDGGVVLDADKLLLGGVVLGFQEALDASPDKANLTDSTGDWIKLNGVCYCQGNDCHK